MDEQARKQYEQGHKDALIEARLEQHAEHLAVINGSIGDTREELRSLRHGLRAVEAELKVNSEVARRLAQSLQMQSARSISMRAFILTLAGLGVTLAGIVFGVPNGP